MFKGATEEIGPYLLENADIFALEGETTGRTKIMRHMLSKML